MIINFYSTTIIAEIFSAMACHEVASSIPFNKHAAPRTFFEPFIEHVFFYFLLIKIKKLFILLAGFSLMRHCIAE